MFTNKDGNIITDENDDIEDNIEITGVDNEDDKYYSPPEETKEIVSPLEEIYSPLEENFSQPETTWDDINIIGVTESKNQQQQNMNEKENHEQEYDMQMMTYQFRENRLMICMWQ